jgi:hypothetical protein
MKRIGRPKYSNCKRHKTKTTDFCIWQIFFTSINQKNNPHTSKRCHNTADIRQIVASKRLSIQVVKSSGP